MDGNGGISTIQQQQQHTRYSSSETGDIETSSCGGGGNLTHSPPTNWLTWLGKRVRHWMDEGWVGEQWRNWRRPGTQRESLFGAVTKSGFARSRGQWCVVTSTPSYALFNGSFTFKRSIPCGGGGALILLFRLKLTTLVLFTSLSGWQEDCGIDWVRCWELDKEEEGVIDGIWLELYSLQFSIKFR